jgi:hypothetical protein
MTCIIGLMLCFAALIAGVQRLKVYRESHSSRAAAIHQLKMIRESMDAFSAQEQNSTNALLAAQTAQMRQILRTVTVADGISKSEAEIIAKCYFHQHVGCGNFSGIRDGGHFWIVDGAFGYAGQPIEGFHVDKRTGQVKSSIGPSYLTPFEIFP